MTARQLRIRHHPDPPRQGRAGCRRAGRPVLAAGRGPAALGRLALPGEITHGHGVLRGPGGRLYGLLIGLDDRIGSEQARLLHHFIEVGEYGLALEEIAGTLAQDTIAITGQERDDMLALAARMNLDGGLVPRARSADGHQRRSV